MVRINHTEKEVVFGMRFEAESLVSEIQDAVECRTGMRVEDQRLIFGGRELDPSKTLEELNVHPKEVLHLLPRLPYVCREWAATGSCSRGRRCYQKGTHTVGFSPRYVEHHAKQNKDSPSSTPESVTPQSASPPSTPEVGPLKMPTPPTVPHPSPPSYGVVGATRRMPSYGLLGMSQVDAAKAVSMANWKGCPEMALREGGIAEQSNSGDWEGLVNAITSAVDTKTMEVEEDLVEPSWEETSWEEAALSGALMGFSCDSSYDSQSSMCTGEHSEVTQALEGRTEGSQNLIHVKTEPGKLHLEGICESAAVVPVIAQNPRSQQTQIAQALNQKETAGLEFAAGVHLIEEMENQVKQWEESESVRHMAYHSFVTSQMMRTAALHNKGDACQTQVQAR